MARRIFIAVAEVSGDKHAAQLIRSLKQLEPDIIIEGLGGPEMMAAGALIHRNTVTKAAMGWRGLLRAFEVMDLLKWTRRHFESNRPDLLIGVDSPSMNFHFARIAHEMHIPVLQYVAPQLWAWARWRMKKLRRWVDQVACILPFEEQWFREQGVNATFVGHPLFDQLPADRGADRPDFTPDRPPVIGLLTGSRKSEAESNFPGLLEAAKFIRRDFPAASFLVPTTPATNPIVERELNDPSRIGAADSVGSALRTNDPRPNETVRNADPTQIAQANLNASLTVGLNQFDEMVPRCDLCLTVSGTATLHVAGFGVPMIVVYRAGRLVWHMAGRWLVPTRTFALVNVLAQRQAPTLLTNGDPPHHLVPEFVPWFGSGELIAQAALDLLHHPQELAEQRNKLRQLIAPLDHPGASDATARLALAMIHAPKPVSTSAP
jgi:lipid-A-disaccharide synthase